MGIYKKPIAFIMMLLAIAGTLIYLAYGLFMTQWQTYGAAVLLAGKVDAEMIAGAPCLLGQLPKSWLGFMSKLPLLGGNYFLQYVTLGICGSIGLIALLGLTGKKGKLGFLFVLLADAVYCLYKLWTMHEGKTYFVKISKMPEILEKLSKAFGGVMIVDYVVYGLLLLAGIFFVASLASGGSEFGTTGGAGALPILYMALLVAGYVALLVLPSMKKLTITADLMRYIVYGVWGLSFLITIVGIHNGQLSRGVNAWLSWGLLMAMVLMFVTNVVLEFVAKSSDKSALQFVFMSISPALPLMTVASFTAADLRN